MGSAWWNWADVDGQGGSLHPFAHSAEHPLKWGGGPAGALASHLQPRRLLVLDLLQQHTSHVFVVTTSATLWPHGHVAPDRPLQEEGREGAAPWFGKGKGLLPALWGLLIRGREPGGTQGRLNTGRVRTFALSWSELTNPVILGPGRPPGATGLLPAVPTGAQAWWHGLPFVPCEEARPSP